jgi:hypothetical protein
VNHTTSRPKRVDSLASYKTSFTQFATSQFDGSSPFDDRDTSLP